MSKQNPNPNEDAAEIQALLQIISADQHAIQSTIALEYSLDHPLDGDDLNRRFKHLRMGIDNALVEHGALVQTLFDAGVISEIAYYRNLAAYSQQEKERRVAELQKRFPNTKLTFG